MQAVKAFLVVVLLAGAAACQRAPAPAEVKPGGTLHEFTPDVFHNTFAATTVPVLRVSSGDSIHLTTIDAAGTDEKGIRRAAAGNPQTGPFYIEGAEPGDTVAVHINRLRLNRDWAISTDTLSSLAVTLALAARMNGRGQLVRWRLDLKRGIAMRGRESVYPEGIRAAKDHKSSRRFLLTEIYPALRKSPGLRIEGLVS